MKRLILATTLALAVTTLGALPAAAAAPEVVAQASTDTAPEPSPDPAADSAGEPDGTADGTDSGGAADGTDPGADPGTADSEGAADGTPPDPTTPAEADVDGADDAESTPSETPTDIPIEASLGLENTEVTVDELADPDRGIRFFVDGVLAGDTISWGDGDGATATAQEDGTFTATYYSDAEVQPGDTVTVTVSVQRGELNETYSATATVIEGEGETEPPSSTTLDITPKSQTLDSFLSKGVSVMMAGCTMDSTIEVIITTKYDPDTVLFQGKEQAGEDTAGVFTYVRELGDSDGSGYVGEYLVRAECGVQYEEGSFTVTDNGDEELEPVLWIQPEKLSGADFVNRDKGVTMTVKDCYTSDSVRFQVWRKKTNELLYDRTAPNEYDGLVSVQTYGLENDPSAYVGTYTVQALCGDTAMGGEFVVTGSGSGGGGNGGSSGGGGNSGSMPRTGAELTGLGAGALLILAGAGAVLFARRRGHMKG